MPGPEKNKIPPQFPIDLPHVKNALKFYKDCCQAMLTLLLDHPDPAIAAGVAALLGRWYFDEGQRYTAPATADARWTTYQLSHARCARVLASHEARILELVPTRDWRTPLGVLRRRTSRWI